MSTDCAGPVPGPMAEQTHVQATVSGYDSPTRSGAVLLDDGTELSFTADALEHSGLRLLRSGQRVRVDLSGVDGKRRVVRVQIYTLA